MGALYTAQVSSAGSGRWKLKVTTAVDYVSANACVSVLQIVNSSCKPLLVAEGQEEDIFWNCLGGKGNYRHFERDKVRERESW